MLAITAASPHIAVCASALRDSGTHAVPSVLFVCSRRKRVRKRRILSLNLVEDRAGGSLLGFSKELLGACAVFVSRSRSSDCEGDWELEAEILEFMKCSKNPGAFPSKKELIDAGRMDLVDAIRRTGGWLSLGWDSDEEERSQESGIGDWEMTIAAECKSFGESCMTGADESPSSEMVSFHSESSSQSASSSGCSLEKVADESGIVGILSRLEKQRNLTFGLGLREKGDETTFSSGDRKEDRLQETSVDMTAAGLQRSNTLLSVNGALKDLKGNISERRCSDINGLKDCIMNDSRGNFYQKRFSSGINISSEPVNAETWRAWSNWRAGCQGSNFEAAEIDPYETRVSGAMDDSVDEIHGVREVPEDLNLGQEEISTNHIQERLQHLELELSSVLRSIKSSGDTISAQEDQESSPDKILKLSDAWEFQETEIMNTKDKLRSIRAKIAVLEGKMALAIIDAQKIVEEKQKRIDDARRTLRLLRTACIVWPNSASEVLLAGSFDGWTTKRKMEKSSTGIFTLYLKLYPGRYEIKFIVDGEWRIDPLRPIVHNNGYENNLLIIT